MAEAKYIIGIDLGTTNCTMAYGAIDKDQSRSLLIEQVPIFQTLSSGVEGSNHFLPSFIYYPLPEEISNNFMALPWTHSAPYCVGIGARERGSEIPSRLISSAKSWLCHLGIDRRKPFLPYDSDAVTEKISPLDACTTLLSHLKKSWDFAHPEDPFVDQHILVTVPASFDPSARQLVEEAADQAGYPSTILLEEPQAAFYAWLYAHESNWRDLLRVGDSILIVDIGGGTTDFTLIEVEEEQGNLILKRRAVGAHLLLGGDNIDLGLAYLVKQKMEDQGSTLDAYQFQGLVHQCRRAKEILLGDDPPPSTDITLLGRGSRLIGQSLKIEITKEEVHQFVLDGFLPLLSPLESSSLEKRSGIQQIGLSYAQDPRISSQLAKFLSMTGESDSSDMSHFVLPTAVLFNGGTMKATALRQRILALLNQWAEKLSRPVVQELKGADYDFGVSRGSVYYGLARLGRAIRIRAGTNRSYFVGVEEAVPAVPGIEPPLRAVCIVPFGMEEGEEKELTYQEFALVLGELATFRFFSRSTPTLSNGAEVQVGTRIRNWKQELTELHPIETLLDKAESDGKTVRIKIKSKVTELGVLELWCVGEDQRKWKLEFDIRSSK